MMHFWTASLTAAVELKACVERRVSEGGAAPASVRAQIKAARARLGE